MLSFKRGDPVTFEFTVLNDVNLSKLGEPTVAIAQDNLGLSLDILSVNTVTRKVRCQLSASKSALLVADIPTVVQLSFNAGTEVPDTDGDVTMQDDQIVVFPEHEVTIINQYVTVNPVQPDDDVNQFAYAPEDPEADEPVEDDVQFDEEGEPVSEYTTEMEESDIIIDIDEDEEETEE